MNNMLLRVALTLVTIILLTSITIYTEFTTFVAEEKRVVFHKLVLRGLSRKKHVPYIITVERIFLLSGGILFGLIFTAVMIMVQETIRILTIIFSCFERNVFILMIHPRPSLPQLGIEARNV